jgi:hypothetical protein
MDKLNYNETTQLRTRMAIIESQLEVANCRASNLKTQKKQLIKIIKQLGVSQDIFD